VGILAAIQVVKPIMIQGPHKWIHIQSCPIPALVIRHVEPQALTTLRSSPHPSQAILLVPATRIHRKFDDPIAIAFLQIRL
jgi:hypothetical protein